MAKLSEEKGEHAIALVLRYGSGVSTFIMALGLSLLLLRGPGIFLPEAHRLKLGIVLSNLLHFDPAALIEIGLLLLLLTPIFRIIVAAVTFGLERDMKYVVISLVVLAVVLFSFFLAIEG